MIGERQREDMRDFLVKAYADGVIGEAELEERLGAMEAATGGEALELIAVEVRARYPVPAAPAFAPAPAARDEALSIRGRGMSKKYRGDWYRGELLEVDLELSSVELDFREYAAYPGSCIHIAARLRTSTLKIRLPRGADVVDELDNDFSSIKIKRKGENETGLILRLRGSADMGTVKVYAR